MADASSKGVSDTVYIIDADSAVRDSLATVMRLSGRPAMTFATGQDFLEQWSSDHGHCVVCEAQLPDTTGIALFQALRPQQPDLRFALMVSGTNSGFAAQANRAGIQHVFVKPLVNERLLTFVSRTQIQETNNA